MEPLGHLEQMLMNGEITEAEYKKKKAENPLRRNQKFATSLDFS